MQIILPIEYLHQHFLDIPSYFEISNTIHSLSMSKAVGHDNIPCLLRPKQHSPLPMFPASWLRLLQRSDTLATLCEDELYLTTPSPARFLLFPRRNWPFPVLSVVNCLDFAATVTAFYCPLTYAG